MCALAYFSERSVHEVVSDDSKESLRNKVKLCNQKTDHSSDVFFAGADKLYAVVVMSPNQDYFHTKSRD